MTQKRFLKLLMGSKRCKEKQTLSHYFARNCVRDVIAINRTNEWNFQKLRQVRGNDFHVSWRGQSYQDMLEKLKKSGVHNG